MAGIAGVQGSNVNALETMLASLQHRGSRETWTRPTEHTTIGCCKLGMESGQQRQLNSQANGKSAILDGYFYTETSRGLSDTSLVLYLYERFGAQWLGRHDGEFYFASEAKEEIEVFPHIAFQTKRSFGSGAGSTKLLGLIAEKEITDEESMENRCTEDGFNIHSIERLLYYRIFKEKFKHPSLPQLIAVWDPFKPGF
jgi:hypothetical protein